MGRIPLIAGTQTSSSGKGVVVNESAVAILGYTSPNEAIGNILFNNYEITGVSKDYNEQSLHKPIAPAMYWFGRGYLKFFTIDIAANIPETVAWVEQEWKKTFSNKPFEYFFLDDFFNRQYERDNRLANFFGLFSALSIFIACLGLFGFSYFVVHQRVKEIGIRKVLGATATSLARLLAQEFVGLIIIAGALSIPVTYYLSVHWWLAAYSYKISLHAIYFLAPVMIVACVALFTIGLHLLKTIKANPVDSLSMNNDYSFCRKNNAQLSIEIRLVSSRPNITGKYIHSTVAGFSV